MLKQGEDIKPLVNNLVALSAKSKEEVTGRGHKGGKQERMYKRRRQGRRQRKQDTGRTLRTRSRQRCYSDYSVSDYIY